MITLTLYIYTNNIDLHCVSAFETIKLMKPDSGIDSLERYRQFKLNFDVNTLSEAQSELSTLISSSYDLLNPNKESYYIDTIPSIKDNYSHVIEVASKHSSDDHQLYQRIKTKYPKSPLQNLTQSVIWHFLCQHSLSQDSIESLHADIIVTASRTQGLLVNPLFESVRICQLQSAPSLSS